jgi:hypothetical protein
MKKETKPQEEPKKPRAREKIEAYGIEQLCENIRIGKSLDYCAKEIGCSWSTLSEWVNEKDVKIDMYARAREERAHKLADDILEVASESCLTETFKGEELVIELSPAMVARNRLRVDTMKWAAAKLLPKVYSDKLDLTSGGEKLQFAPINMPALDKKD